MASGSLKINRFRQAREHSHPCSGSLCGPPCPQTHLNRSISSTQKGDRNLKTPSFTLKVKRMVLHWARLKPHLRGFMVFTKILEPGLQPRLTITGTKITLPWCTSKINEWCPCPPSSPRKNGVQIGVKWQGRHFRLTRGRTACEPTLIWALFLR